MEERFEKHREFLVDRIDPDFGLLDKLRANRNLTREAVHKIKLKDNTTEDKNRILLDFILKNKKANELVSALRESGQIHLVNYLNADGEWAQKRFSEKKRVLNEAEITETNPQGIEDSDDVPLRGDLESKLKVTERSSLSTALVENSRRTGGIQESSYRPKPFGKICECDASTQTDEESLMKKITDSNEECLNMKKKLEQELEKKENLMKLLEEYQRQIGDLFLALEKLKVEGEVLEGSEEEQQTRDIRTIENFLEVLKQRQQNLPFQLRRDLEEEEFLQPSNIEEEEFPEERDMREYERSKQKQLEPTDFGLRSENNPDPVLFQTIRTKAAEENKKLIFGLTILGKELFIVSELSSEIEVYDTIAFSFTRRWNLKELIDPLDIESCNRNECLYINDYKGFDQSKEILRVDRNGKLIKKWSTGDNWGYSLFVTNESNVILTVTNKQKLNEYSSDGQLIREVNLSLDANICYPFYAIKLTNGHFVVSHSCYNDLNGVCIVDANGNLLKSFSGKRVSTIGQMSRPVYLAVDRNDFIMVADQWNSRVFLLDSDLEFKRQILSKQEHEMQNPCKILLNAADGQLFVADNEENNNRILIFDFK